MGNRSFLYVGTRAQVERGDGTPFADANNTFPSLWRLLLADGQPAAANEAQRVFGNAGTLNLAAPAAPGIARLRQLAEGIRQHPLHGTQPYLDQHFEALLAHCEATSAALGDGDVWFTANLDELSWMDSAPPDRFLEQERATCNAVAERVAAALDAQDFPAVDNALEIDSYGATFADWRSWAWNFGFGGIDHPYFAMRDEPRTVAWADFAPDEDDQYDDAGDDGESFLGNGLERVRVNGLVGVQRVADVVGLRTKPRPPTPIIPPEWEAIDHAGRVKKPLFWVTRDGKRGLVRADEKGCTVLQPCTLDDVWSFEQAGDRWVATVVVGDHIGLLGDDGQWIARPEAIVPPASETWAFTGRYAVARSGDTQGVLDTSGTWVIAPSFASVDNLQDTGVAIATISTGGASTFQLVSARTGGVLTPPQRALRWLDWPGVFEGRQHADGTTGWWRPDGAVLIAAAWDGITLLQEKPWLVRVERDGLCGVRDRDDRERIPVAWSGIASRNDAGYALIEGHLDECIVERDGRFGLLDGSGRTRVPVEYDGIGNFPPVDTSDDGPPSFYAPAVQVQRRTPDGDRSGAWHLELGREVVPCEYHHVFAITLWTEGTRAVRGYMAVQHAPGDETGDLDPLRVGLFREDGTLLHAVHHAWIAERHHVTELVDAMLVARAIQRAWTANEPVRAALSDEDRYVWLRRDGTVLDDLQVLTGKYRTGDFTAAHTLSQMYRDGVGMPQDAALARRWLLLAAGQPERLFDAPAPGLFRRLLGARAPSPVVPDGPDARADVQAMCDLAQELITGDTDADQQAAARAWMEIAVTRGTEHSRGNAEAHMLLGYLLLEGVGGPRDEARALALSTAAAALGNSSASFNLGIMHEQGRGVPVDRAKALAHYGKAATSGDLQADLVIGRLLLQPADDGTAPPAKSVKQAVYHLQRAMDCITDDIAAAAKGELGRLYWSGTGVKQDRARATALLREAEALGDGRAIAFLAEAGQSST